MSRGRANEGMVRYTGRGLRQDAAEAMGSDLVRGLIEAITNSDDSYARAEARTGSPGTGKIWIGVQHSRGKPTYKVQLGDRAGGMSRDEMMGAILDIGGRTSGFEKGAEVRGNRGRGAKDLVAFGEVTFESIKDGRLTRLELRPDGSYTCKRDHSASKDDRKRLQVPRGNGTQVTIEVQRAFRCPRHERLAELLERDFQLRGIMADPGREVALAKIGDRSAPQKLRYSVDWGSFEKLLSSEIEVDGYPGVTAKVEAFKLSERCDSPPADRTRPCGLLLTGRRAIYDNTLFRFESLPYAGWLAGRIECAAIDRLAREYDDRDEAREEHPAENPIPIITRRRSGLAPDHPFAKALSSAIEEALQPVVDQLEADERQESRELESAETRRELDRLGREAAKLLQQSLREIEEEEDPGGQLGMLEDIAIVPDPLIVEEGQARRFSVICARDGLEEGEDVLLSAEPHGVIDFADDLVPLGAHRDREDALSARGELRGLSTAECLLTAKVNGREQVTMVKVVDPEPEPDPEPPDGLEFERGRLRVGLGKRRTMELRAPAELVERAESAVSLRSNDEGIVILGGGATLAEDPDYGWYVGSVRVEGRALGASGTVLARLGEESAELAVRVVERDHGLPDLRIEFSPEEPIDFRAYFDPPVPGPDGSQVLKILVRHKAVSQVLGKEQENEFEAQWKVLLAEVVTEAIVRRIIGRRFPVAHEVEAQTLLNESARWTAKILPKLQRILLRADVASLRA